LSESVRAAELSAACADEANDAPSMASPAVVNASRRVGVFMVYR
jgi:hypothetical protein